MRGEMDGSAVCSPEQVMRLVAGELDAAEAMQLEEHLQRCASCQGHEVLARSLLAAAEAARDVPEDHEQRARLWQRVSSEAEAAASRMRSRAAWRTIFAGRRIRLAAAGLLALALLLVLSLRSRRSSPDAGPSAVMANAAVETARPATEEPSHRGDSPSRRAAASTSALTPPPRGLGPEAHSSRRSPRPRPPARDGARGWRQLACGAALRASGSATIVRDQLAATTVRLDEGQVTLRVPRLPSGGRLEVVTLEATVTVKGTELTVVREKGETLVSVRHGTVWVQPAGRNRPPLVLGAGEEQTVVGEAAYLERILRRIDAAIDESDFARAESLARCYLNTATRPDLVAQVRLRLAGSLARQGRVVAAERSYRTLAADARQPVAAENALALLAAWRARRGDLQGAGLAWKELVQRFPEGAHAREARLRLVRVACRARTAEARSLRLDLARRYPRDPAAAAVLRDCRPGDGP